MAPEDPQKRRVAVTEDTEMPTGIFWVSFLMVAGNQDGSAESSMGSPGPRLLRSERGSLAAARLPAAVSHVICPQHADLLTPLTLVAQRNH